MFFWCFFIKQENVKFILYLIFGLLLSTSGVFLIALNLLMDRYGLYFMIGVLSYVVGFIFVYLMRKSISKINFEINNQKRLMLVFITFSWTWFLSGITLILYLIISYLSSQNQELSIFYYILFAGFSGGIWSVGFSEVYSFWNWTKFGKKFLSRFDWSKKGSRIDWYSPNVFKKNLLIWVRYFFYAIFFWIFLMFAIPIIL